MTARSSTRDYYAILGVSPDATEEDVRRAFRRLALRWHPDRNPGDATASERFKEISEAYAVLIDGAKRRQYDRARVTGAPGGFSPSRDDLFRDLFADPRASAVFEELAREFARLGLRVDRRSVEHTLFGGRGVVVGSVVVVSPITPLALFRMARAVVRAMQPPAPPSRAPAPGGGLLGRVARAARALLAGPSVAASSDDVVMPLRITHADAAHGARTVVTLDGEAGRRDVVVTVPPGTRAGTMLRLRGQGPARRGDVYLAVEIADRND